MLKLMAVSAAAVAIVVPAAVAQNLCDEAPPIEVIPTDDVVPQSECPAIDPGAAPLVLTPWRERLLRYSEIAEQHRLAGLASYYSTFFDGRKTANGEIYRNRKFSAAHLTLPLGCWIEVTSRATGRKLRMRVNDRGPFTKKFCLDLSQAAARYLGVDVAPDRYVDIRIIALPGEDPLPEDVDMLLAGGGGPAETLKSAEANR